MQHPEQSWYGILHAQNDGRAQESICLESTSVNCSSHIQVQMESSPQNEPK